MQTSDLPTNSGTKTFAALLLIAVPLVFFGAFTLLGSQFEYPQILRKPTGYVLEQFAAGGSSLLGLWYTMLVSALLFIPLAFLVRGLWHGNRPVLGLAMIFGILAGIVQALGFLRWVFVVPGLSASYLDPAAGEATKAAVSVVFDAFHRYAGMGIGEHLGYLFTGLWTVLISWALLEHSPWLGRVGVVLGVGILTGMLEVAGVSWAGTLNALSYLLWAVWMVAFGVMVLRSRTLLVSTAV
ncbi:MAG: DUF4386 domain-containing protein [Thermaceae bacterium]|nr:DUF4386 domain-containing protein [Thermaceae bacterium]